MHRVAPLLQRPITATAGVRVGALGVRTYHPVPDARAVVRDCACGRGGVGAGIARGEGPAGGHLGGVRARRGFVRGGGPPAEGRGLHAQGLGARWLSENGEPGRIPTARTFVAEQVGAPDGGRGGRGEALSQRKLDPVTGFSYYGNPPTVAIRQRLVQAEYDKAPQVRDRYSRHAESIGAVMQAFAWVSNIIKGDAPPTKVQEQIQEFIDRPLPKELAQDDGQGGE